MESLQVRTGQISLQILDDESKPRGTFKFNPTDIESAKQLLGMQDEFVKKQKEFDEREKLAKTPEDVLNLLDEVVLYFNEMIDNCFGEGSSQILFGGAKTLSMYDDFFTGITPYYEKESKKRTAKYKKTK